MKKLVFRIEEVSARTIIVLANSEEEGIEKADCICLDYDDFVEKTITYQREATLNDLRLFDVLDE